MKNKIKNLPLLAKVAIAIALGITCSFFFPEFLNRTFVTINGIFGNFLGFTIPLIIVGLVAPGIAELGKGAG
ncbi:MAG: dicarboxylate/amino acid:cation symporter, partial [Bacteroidales bacterium]|nr:dicarboxylate/amino acid:cation symporter [Bacteroidales bacterium]